MHDLSSRHLAKFIGVAIDTNIVYIVREEYSMGSLHQVLHNPTKKLDSSFKYSFALDIIKVCVCVRARARVCVCVCMRECVYVRGSVHMYIRRCNETDKQVCVLRLCSAATLCLPPSHRGCMPFILASLVPTAT